MSQVPDTPEKMLGQKLRDWAIDVLGFTTDAEKRQIVIAQRGQFYDSNGAPTGEAIQSHAPKVPFLVINVTVAGIEYTTGSHHVRASDNKRVYKKAGRQASISVNGYGLVTNAWLEELGIRYKEIDAPVSLLPRPGGISDISDLVENDYIEARYLREFTAFYAVGTVGKEEAPAETVETDITTDGTSANNSTSIT